MTSSSFEPRPLAVNLFSVRRELVADFEGTHARLAEIGFQGVEPMIFDPKIAPFLPEDMRVPFPPPADYRALLDRHDLSVASLHAPLPEGELANYVLDFAGALGTDQLVLASFMVLPDAANAHADADVLDVAIERFGRAAETAGDRDISVGFHNHHFEWEVDLGGEFAWDRFWRKVDPRVRAEVDVYWAATAGRDPIDVIETLGDRVARVHLKDGPCVLDVPQVAFGEGRVDIEGCVRAARHVPWHIVEFDECASDIFEALASSAGYLVDRGLSLARS